MSGPNDLILIYFDDRPSLYARIESIEPDAKKNWYHVSLLLLTIPIQSVTWILRDEYIAGATFTMGGRPVRFEEIKHPLTKTDHQAATPLPGEKGPAGSGNVIPFKRPKGE